MNHSMISMSISIKAALSMIDYYLINRWFISIIEVWIKENALIKCKLYIEIYLLNIIFYIQLNKSN